MTTKIVGIPSGSTFQIPSDYGSLVSINSFGAGATGGAGGSGGGGYGGAGGSFAITSDDPGFSPNQTVNIQIGLPGGGTGTKSSPGTADTWFYSATSCLYAQGPSDQSPTSASENFPTTGAFAGGEGQGGGENGGQGGGAGGPSGAGLSNGNADAGNGGQAGSPSGSGNPGNPGQEWFDGTNYWGAGGGGAGGAYGVGLGGDGGAGAIFGGGGGGIGGNSKGDSGGVGADGGRGGIVFIYIPKNASFSFATIIG